MLIHKANKARRCRGSFFPYRIWAQTLRLPQVFVTPRQWIDNKSASPTMPFDTPVTGLGPGAAVGGVRLEINTRYSCYLTAARRRRERREAICLKYQWPFSRTNTSTRLFCKSLQSGHLVFWAQERGQKCGSKFSPQIQTTHIHCLKLHHSLLWPPL